MSILPLALGLALAAGPAQDAPSVEVLDHAGLTGRLQTLAREHARLATLSEYGESREGHELHALRITAVEEPGQHPALLLVANLEGPRVFESGVALQHAEQLLAGYETSEDVKALLDSTVLWIVPRANPDPAEAYFASPRHERWTGSTGIDNDRDGLVDCFDPDCRESRLCDELPQEVYARLDNGEVTVRPLAGTRRRGVDHAEDEALETELLADPKEIAEHLMLIDLGRNDIGRVCQTGTVEVTEMMIVERYAHVMHIASNVQGQIRSEHNAMDVLRATLPVGTLSGAPKVRALAIIDELEPEKRGIFGGAVGYLSWNGNMDTAIAIRTAVIRDNRLYIQAGAGVVADSVPKLEWKETMNKARSIFRAAAMAESGHDLSIDASENPRSANKDESRPVVGEAGGTS